EKMEDGLLLPSRKQRRGMEQSDVSHNPVVRIQQGKAHITYGIHGWKVGVVGKQLDYLVGYKKVLLRMYDTFAGGVRYGVLIVVHILSIQPKSQGLQLEFFGIIFRHPDTGDPECDGQVLDQQAEILPADDGMR